MTISLATVTRGKINEQRHAKNAQQTGRLPDSKIQRIPVERISTVVVTGLIIGSVIVHTGTVSRFGL